MYDGEKADIWSCGIVLFTILEGTLPFDHKNMNSLFNLIKEAKYRFPRTCSKEAKDLVNKMLQPNPLKRISLEEIKQHPWFNENLEEYLFDYKLFHSQEKSKIDFQVKQKVIKLNPNLKYVDDNILCKLTLILIR